MIAEIGHFALIIALVTSILQASVPLIATYHAGLNDYMRLAVPLQLLSAAGIIISFACLLVTFITSDFSVALVAQHSPTACSSRARVFHRCALLTAKIYARYASVPAHSNGDPYSAQQVCQVTRENQQGAQCGRPQIPSVVARSECTRVSSWQCSELGGL